MSVDVAIHQSGGVVRVETDGSVTVSPSGQGLNFYSPAGAGPWTGQQNITGSKGANAALASLITALANLGLVTDSTT